MEEQRKRPKNKDRLKTELEELTDAELDLLLAVDDVVPMSLKDKQAKISWLVSSSGFRHLHSLEAYRDQIEHELAKHRQRTLVDLDEVSSLDSGSDEDTDVMPDEPEWEEEAETFPDAQPPEDVDDWYADLPAWQKESLRDDAGNPVDPGDLLAAPLDEVEHGSIPYDAPHHPTVRELKRHHSNL